METSRARRLRAFLNYAAGRAPFDVVVRESNIPNAGLGLFANRAFAAGELIALYRGVYLPPREAVKVKDRCYVMRVGPGVWLDARLRGTCVARFANDALGLARAKASASDARRANNAFFEKLPEWQAARLVARRPIKEGEEVLVDYGSAYWQGAALQIEGSA